MSAYFCTILHKLFSYSLRFKSGRQDSNLRPSAPVALDSLSEALGFKAITFFAYFYEVCHNKLRNICPQFSAF